MSVVTIAEAWPAAGRPFTVAELDRIPDDGRRYELRAGGYAPVAKTSQPFAVGRPFTVSIDPADLTRGLPRSPWPARLAPAPPG